MCARVEETSEARLEDSCYLDSAVEHFGKPQSCSVDVRNTSRKCIYKSRKEWPGPEMRKFRAAFISPKRVDLPVEIQ